MTNAKPREFVISLEQGRIVPYPDTAFSAGKNPVRVIEYSAFEAITNQLNSALEGMNEYAKRLRECETKYARAIAVLKECDDQMQYYSCEIRDNPSSWNEVMDKVHAYLGEATGGEG